MKKYIIPLFFPLFLCVCGRTHSAEGIYNVTDFGAKGDGTTLCTREIQTAIDTCARDGGGTVVVPRGTFLAGSLFLKENVTLEVQKMAVLRASERHEDYAPVDFCPQNRAFATDYIQGSHFLIAVEQKNVAIRGEGTICGSADAFVPKPKDGVMWPKPKLPWRPGQMLFFCECDGVRLEGVTLTESPYWTCFLHGCTHVRISNVTIRNRHDIWNSDGIDLDCCQNVVISDCDIDTGDDCITLRANTEPLKNPRPCERIVVTNCVLRSACQGVRVGVGDGLIRDAVFSNLVIYETNCGLNFHSSYRESSPGTTIENIRFCNITLDVNIAFEMTYGHAQSDRKISDVFFDGISGRSKILKRFTPTEGMEFENVQFSNVSVTFEKEEG